MDAGEFTSSQLAELLRDARARTLALVADLSDEQMIGPRLPIVNPPLWEIGHVAWTQEFWLLRHLGKRGPLLEGGDALYNSTEVAHDTRWDLSLLSREKTLDYMQTILDQGVEFLISRKPDKETAYFPWLVIFHEDMHDEAIAYTRQTLGYPAPKFGKGSGVFAPGLPTPSGPLPGDAEIPGGSFMLGATPGLPFVFDNEKWAHVVQVKPFRIARAPVTNVEFAAFVDDRGYRRAEFWSEEGWRWLRSGGSPALEASFAKFFNKNQEHRPESSSRNIERPVYWQRGVHGRRCQRVFDALVPLQEHLPALHVNWYEAEAYCNWAGRRLPTEAEWEMAASCEPEAGRGIGQRKRLFPWGDEPPTAERANLDWRFTGCLEVGALPAGDSAFGCRQMIGNVWEWTASDFRPYPGFVADPYKEYSQPWFATHKVLRGGCWATRSRLIRNTWRNFYTPDRRDVWAGFRTCAK